MLLKQAALDGSPIRRSDSMRGVEIRAGKKAFFEGADLRGMAEWDHALRELDAAGLTEDRNSAGEVFKVTHEGYAAADKIVKDW